MINSKTALVFLVIVSTCYGEGGHMNYYKKKHHHHHYGMHHHHFLYYLTFLAIKLKIFFFLGTIFTVSLVAAKVVGIIKLAEYMKHKHHHEEEKIVYVNPHEHHDHHDYGGYPGGYAGPSDYISSKTSYPSYPAESTFSDFSADQPPADAYLNDRYSTASGGPKYTKSTSTGTGRHNIEGSFGSQIYSQIMAMAKRLRQLNVTDIALNEMGIKDEHCKKKFICKADFNGQRNIILRTGIGVLSDASYVKYKPNITITSEEECDSLHDQCKEHIE